MSEVIRAKSNRGIRSGLPGIVGFWLAVLAVVGACCISLLIDRPIRIEKPVLLMFGAVVLLVPLKSGLPNSLQQITGFYLLSIPVNLAASQYHRFDTGFIDVSVSYGAGVLLLCGCGYVLAGISSSRPPASPEASDITRGWIVALGVLGCHMALLAVVLSRFYGYGFERDPGVLGSLCLYLLLFVFLWDRLARLRFRQVVGLALSVFYLGLFLAKHQS